MVNRRRARLTIIAQILTVARNGTLKTHIMLRTGMSYGQLSKYLSLLQERGLLEIDTKNGREVYHTTQKGNSYLETFAELRDLL